MSEPALTAMRRLHRLVAVLAVTVVSLFVAPQPACACSCAPLTDAQYFEHADLVFVGVVTGEDRSLVGNSSVDPVQIKFQVESVSKGTASGALTLRTAASSASCGWEFSLGRRFKVYAKDGQTSLCSGNKDLGAAPEVPLDKGFPFGWLAAGGGVLVAGLIAYAVHRRRKQL